MGVALSERAAGARRPGPRVSLPAQLSRAPGSGAWDARHCPMALTGAALIRKECVAPGGVRDPRYQRRYPGATESRSGAPGSQALRRVFVTRFLCLARSSSVPSAPVVDLLTREIGRASC